MANLLKFFRVEALPTTGVIGGLYFVHGGEIAAGNGKLYVCTAANTFELYSGANASELTTKLNDYVLKTQKIAGVDLQDDITAEELKTALGLGSAAYTTVAALESTMDSKDKAIAEAAATDAQNKANAALDAAKAWVEEQEYVTASIIDGLATEDYVGNAVKTEADIARAAEKALAERLDIVEGEGEGSIKKAVADAKAAVIGDATEAGNTLGKLEDRIETIVENEKTYSIAKVTEGLGENVKEAFKLVDEDGTQVGETISIYKDSSLISVELTDANAEGVAGQYIKYTYVLANGTESIQYVDVSRLLVEAEFKNGLEVSAAGEVNVKVDAASEAFLTVGENGVKLAGVQAAINTAAAKATTEVVEGTDAGNNLEIAKTTGEDGHSIYTVNLTDVASAAALATLDAEVQEHEEVVAASLIDLNERIEAVSNSIPTELGVMSVSEGTDGNFVTTTVDNTDAANPKVSVAVDYVDGATAGDKLTTNTYVDEHIAAAINAIPAAHVTDVVGDSASYSVVEAPEAGGVHTVKNTLATITVDDDNKATVTEGLATDSFVKTYVENQLSWASF